MTVPATLVAVTVALVAVDTAGVGIVVTAATTAGGIGANDPPAIADSIE